MSLKSTLLAAVAALGLTGAASAADIMVMDPYARSATATSVTGAAFMTLMNHGDQDDTLIAAQSDVAERVELHTHIENEQGVMQMREIEGGIPVQAGGEHALKRGGDHVMFMGLKAPLKDGDIIPLVLTFEKAGDIEVDVPVDLSRKADHGGMSDHSKM
ncbi:copper chaperone PCu(A)C [Rhodobacteraceae bacterium F11138]|nr:copper chaperone PCu(A)C [Rhodobacteraceae bacterium F11138]